LKTNPLIDSIDVSTRRNRRAATNLAIALLEKIYSAEEQHKERNLFNYRTYDAARATADSLFEAIWELVSVFD